MRNSAVRLFAATGMLGALLVASVQAQEFPTRPLRLIVQATPYDTVKDLAPIAAFSIAPFVLCVSAESRLKTLNDLIATAKAEPGRLTYASSGTGTLPQIKANKFRALVVTGARRSPMLSDVPTVAELGLKGAEAEFVTGILAPSGTPRAVVTRLQDAALKVAQSADFREFLAQQGYEPLSSSAMDFTTRVRDGLVKWAVVVKERNIKVEQ